MSDSTSSHDDSTPSVDPATDHATGQTPVDVSPAGEPAPAGATQPTEVLPPGGEPAADATPAAGSTQVGGSTHPAYATPAAGSTQPAVPRPRIRSGAIVWGVIVSAVAVFMLGIVTSPANSAAFAEWTGALGWGGVTLAAVIAVGAFILIMALLSVIRAAQRRRAAR